MKNGFLCIGYLENRIGRKLHLADFTEAPVNDPDHSWNIRRLRSRPLRGLAAYQLIDDAVGLNELARHLAPPAAGLRYRLRWDRFGR